MTVFTETRPDKIPKKFKGIDKCYYYRCWYTDIYGKRKRKQEEYCLREKYAKEAEKDFLKDIERKSKLYNLSKSGKITLGELRDDFLRYKEENKKIKPTSLDTIKIKLMHIKEIESIVVEEFSLEQFDNWKKDIDSKKLSTEYKNDIYKGLRSILNYGKKMYGLNISILDKMENFTDPCEIKKEMLFYTKEEFDLFISNESDLRWVCFFSTLFYCGLRQGEALALNWNDIDFKNNTIRINKSLANKVKNISEKYLILPPKTKGSIRTIPIPINLKKLLETQLNEQKEYTNFSYNWFIFGEIFPLPTTTIQKRRDKLVELSGVKRIRIHDFRHSCASLLISKNANITLVARYLGHSDIATTLNTYSHFYKNDLTNLISNIDIS